MAFQISPDVNVSEIDLTTVVPAVATTTGAIAGLYRWGPVAQPILVDSESTLVARFGKPTNFNAETWFTGANFLAYGNQLYVTRAANTTGSANTVTAANNSANTLVITGNTPGISNGDLVYGPGIPSGTTVYNNQVTANGSTVTIQVNKALTASVNGSILTANPTTTFTAIGNTGAIANPLSTFTIPNKAVFDNTTFPTDGEVPYIAKFPGALGNSLQVSQCDSATAFSSNIVTTNTAFVVGSNTTAMTFSTPTAANTALSQLTVGDYVAAGNSTLGTQYLQITAATLNGSNVNLTFAQNYKLAANITETTVTRLWQFFNNVAGAPGTSSYQASFGANTSVVDEVHVVVVDQDGTFTGIPGTVLEVYQNLSRNTQAKTQDGSTNYYRTVLNNNSAYVYNIEDTTTAASGDSTTIVSSTATNPTTVSFNYGSDGSDETAVATSTILFGYDQYRSAENITVSLVLTGRPESNSAVIAGYVADNIVGARKDCVAFISPPKNNVVSNAGNEGASVVAYRNAFGRSTSYVVMDSGYKYQYDKYNDVYRYVPLNGDTAGLCVRTDLVRDPWWSPAGFNRGQILNIVKLAWNPTKADRDLLYSNGINPVVTFPGQGTVLFGDKTLLAKPSAFDRINVRRLFIVLEKAISTASKFTLFEFNDAFTRAQFVSLVTPFLRDVQGRRGIYDFRVVCDDTNNTPEVIDGNRFVGDIYIKPAKSINFIQLNFVAVRTGVEFSEIVGKF